MKSTKCVECGFVGWSDLEHCKACGAPLGQQTHSQHSPNLPPATSNYNQWNQPQEGQKKGLAIFGLILGILSFFTLGLLGVGAIAGIILSYMAMNRVKRDPWQYGGRGMAIAGLVLSIVSLVTVVPIGIIAAIAIPNLLASRRAANEASAVYSLRQISSAQEFYHSHFHKYGSLNELATQNLIDPRLATGTKNGYRFTVELTNDETTGEGFAAVGVPLSYRDTGVRSFYVDESYVIRGSDNSGGPSTRMDPLLNTESEFSNRSRRADYRQQPAY